MANAFGGGIQATKYIEFLNVFPLWYSIRVEQTDITSIACLLVFLNPDYRLLVYYINTSKGAWDVAQLVQYLSKISKGKAFIQAPEYHKLNVRPWREKNRMIWSGESSLVTEQAQGQPEQGERTLHPSLVRQPWLKFEHATLIILFLRWAVIITSFPTVLRVQCTVV